MKLFSNNEYIDFDWNSDSPPTPEQEKLIWSKARELGKVKQNAPTEPTVQPLVQPPMQSAHQSVTTSIKPVVDVATDYIKKSLGLLNPTNPFKAQEMAASQPARNIAKGVFELPGLLTTGVPTSQLPTRIKEQGAKNIYEITHPKEAWKTFEEDLRKPIDEKKMMDMVIGTAFGGSNYGAINKVFKKNVLSDILKPKKEPIAKTTAEFMKTQAESLKSSGLSPDNMRNIAMNKGKELNQIITDAILKETPPKEIAAKIKSLKGQGLAPDQAPPAGMKERAAFKTYQDIDIPLELKEELAKNPERFYEPKKLSEAVTESERLMDNAANDILSNDMQKALDIANKESTPLATAIVSKLADRLGKINQLPLAEDILAKHAKKLTEAGQFINSEKLINKMSTSGIINAIQSRLVETGIKNPAEYTKIPQARKLQLIERAKEIDSMPVGDERSLAEFKLFREINSLVPDKFSKQLIAAYKAGLLSNPVTHGVNLSSNLSHAITENISKVTATAADIVASVFTGKRTTTLPNIGAYLKGFGKGLQKTGDYFKTGHDPRKTISKYDFKQTSFYNNPVFKSAEKATNMVFKALGVEDMPFWYGAYDASIAEQAKVLGMNKGWKSNFAGAEFKKLMNNQSSLFTPEELRTITSNAVQDAMVSTFQNTTKLGTALANLKKDLGPAMEFFAPFTGTPSSFMMQVLNYTPYGVMKELFRKGGISQKDLSMAIGRNVTASGVAALGINLAKKGLLTGSFPQDKREQEQWKLEGKKPNSIKIDGQWRSLNPMGVPGALMAVGGAMVDEYDKTGSISKAAGRGGLTVAKFISEQPFVKGPATIFSTLQDPERNAGRIPSTIVGGMVPAVVGATARTVDPYQRNIKGQNLGAEILNTVKAKVPGASKTLPLSVDVMGNPIKYNTKNGAQFVDVFRSSPERNANDPVIKEFSRLAENEETIATPLPITMKEKVVDSSIKIQPEALTEIQTKVGKTSSKAMAMLINTPQYKALSDTEKKNILQDIYSDIRGIEILRYAEETKQISPEEALYKKLTLLPSNLMSAILSGKKYSLPKNATKIVDQYNKILYYTTDKYIPVIPEKSKMKFIKEFLMKQAAKRKAEGLK